MSRLALLALACVGSACTPSVARPPAEPKAEPCADKRWRCLGDAPLPCSGDWHANTVVVAAGAPPDQVQRAARDGLLRRLCGDHPACGALAGAIDLYPSGVAQGGELTCAQAVVSDADLRRWREQTAGLRGFDRDLTDAVAALVPAGATVRLAARCPLDADARLRWLRTAVEWALHTQGARVTDAAADWHVTLTMTPRRGPTGERLDVQLRARRGDEVRATRRLELPAVAAPPARPRARRKTTGRVALALSPGWPAAERRDLDSALAQALGARLTRAGEQIGDAFAACLTRADPARCRCTLDPAAPIDAVVIATPTRSARDHHLRLEWLDLERRRPRPAVTRRALRCGAPTLIAQVPDMIAELGGGAGAHALPPICGLPRRVRIEVAAEVAGLRAPLTRSVQQGGARVDPAARVVLSARGHCDPNGEAGGWTRVDCAVELDLAGKRIGNGQGSRAELGIAAARRAALHIAGRAALQALAGGGRR